MERIPGLADIEPSREENYPEVNVTVDREERPSRHQLKPISPTPCSFH